MQGFPKAELPVLALANGRQAETPARVVGGTKRPRGRISEHLRDVGSSTISRSNSGSSHWGGLASLSPLSTSSSKRGHTIVSYTESHWFFKSDRSSTPTCHPRQQLESKQRAGIPPRVHIPEVVTRSVSLPELRRQQRPAELQVQQKLEKWSPSGTPAAPSVKHVEPTLSLTPNTGNQAFREKGVNSRLDAQLSGSIIHKAGHGDAEIPQMLTVHAGGTTSHKIQTSPTTPTSQLSDSADTDQKRNGEQQVVVKQLSPHKPPSSPTTPTSVKQPSPHKPLSSPPTPSSRKHQVHFQVPHVLSRRKVDDLLRTLITGCDIFSQSEKDHLHAVFRRYQISNSHEMKSDDLCDVLNMLGYFAVEGDAVTQIWANISRYKTVSLDELTLLLQKYMNFEHSQLRAGFSKGCDVASGRLSVYKLQAVFQSLRIFAPCSTITEVVKMSGLHEVTDLSEEEFLRVVAAYKIAEGATGSELDLEYTVFQKYEALDRNQPWYTKGSFAVMKLAAALTELFGAHYYAMISGMLQKVQDLDFIELEDETAKYPPGVRFLEFASWARCVRASEVKQFCNIFKTHVLDIRQTTTREMTLQMLLQGGFTVVAINLEEFIEEVGKARGCTEIDFDMFTEIGRKVNRRCGFTLKEAAEFAAIFERFCTPGTDGIDFFGVFNMLKYMGFTSTIDETYGMVEDVDVNGNRLLDFQEYLLLMRRHCEREHLQTRKVIAEHSSEDSETLLANQLRPALEHLGHFPDDGMLFKALLDLGFASEVYTFDDFVRIVNNIRRATVSRHRRNAAWTDKELNFIRRLFDKYRKGDADEIGFGELLWLLKETGVNMQTAQERADLLRKLDEARNMARVAGVDQEDVGTTGSSNLRFWPLVHFLRSVQRENTKDGFDEEVQAIRETRFTCAEVAGFREVFSVYSPHRHEIPLPNEEAHVSSRPLVRRTRARHKTAPEQSIREALDLIDVVRPDSPMVVVPTSSKSKVATKIGNLLSRVATPSSRAATPAAVSSAKSGSLFSRGATPAASASRQPGLFGVQGQEDELDETMDPAVLLHPPNDQPRMTLQDVRGLLRSIGLNLNADQRRQLDEEFAMHAVEVKEEKKPGHVGQATQKVPAIFFSGFLHMMRWMLDKNFADMAAATEQVGRRMREAQTTTAES